MSRHHSWLNTATEIIREYKGQQPFATHLKTFFSANKKYGSNDRRQIGHLCFCYFRLGKLANTVVLPVQELITIGLLLCSTGENNLLQTLRPEWTASIHKSVETKLALVNHYYSKDALDMSFNGIFPWNSLLSEGVDPGNFNHSFLVQPHVFIRIRPGFEKQVLQKLQKAGIAFHVADKSDCIVLSNLARLEEVIALNKEAVVQDYNSQQVFSISKMALPGTLNVWDCCAASGGKSILAADTFGQLALTVSDIRPAILANLRKRLGIAGISIQQLLQLDLTDKTILSSLALAPFDLVVCDAPCSGSGTWSRTPESVLFFEPEQLEHYQSLQKKIALNAASQVKPGGYMYYITCSVFAMENERIVEYLLEHAALELIDKRLLRGYNYKADTMFTALFNKKAS